MAVDQQVLVDHATAPEGLVNEKTTTLASPQAGLSTLSLSDEVSATADEIPEAFLTACNGNKKKAKARWEATKKWREENKIDTALERPFLKYPAIRKYYGHFLQGYTLDGNILSIQTPALLDCAGLKASGVAPHDMGVHTAISFEYLFKVMDPRPNAGVVTILDLGDLTLRKAVSFEHLAILKAISDVSENHYPGRVKKILIVNPPRLFNTIFGAIKAVLPASVRDQIEIMVDMKDLQKFVAPEWLPAKFGGCGPEIMQGAPEIEVSEFLFDVIKKAEQQQQQEEEKEEKAEPVTP